MKKHTRQLLSALLILVLTIGLFTAMPAALADAKTISMVFQINENTYTVNGVSMQMDVSPFLIEGRTMIPIRFVAEQLGATVEWDGDTNKVTIQLMDTTLELWIGQSDALVNGTTVPIDPENANVKPLLISKRTMLPLRFVTENLGCDVGWDGATQKVTITKVFDGLSAIDDPEVISEIQRLLSIDPPDINDPDLDPQIKRFLTLYPPIIDDPAVLAELAKVDLSVITGDVPKVSRHEPSKQYLVSNMTLDKDALRERHKEFAENYAASKWDDKSYKNGALTSRDRNLPIMSYVGYGYNMFGYYASTESLMAPVLDIDVLLNDGRIFYKTLDLSSFEQDVSEGAAEYSKKLSARVQVSGSYGFFKATVDTSFSSDHKEESTYYYSTLRYLIRNYELYVNLLPSQLKPFLHSKARSDINDPNISPLELFAHYGTHVVTSLRAGGKLEYNVSSETSAFSDKSEFEMSVTASYNAFVASVNADGKYKTETGESATNSNHKVVVKTYGGTPQDGTTLASTPNAFKEWADSVNNKMSISDFGNHNPVGIWELCDSPARRTELQNAFDELLAVKGASLSTALVVRGLKLEFLPQGQTAQPRLETSTNGVKTTWHKTGTLSTKINNMTLTSMKNAWLYYSKGASNGTGENAPVVDIFLVNHSQGENAHQIFEEKYGNDPTAILWAYVNGRQRPYDNLQEPINDPSMMSVSAPRIYLCYVTSEMAMPITHVVTSPYPDVLQYPNGMMPGPYGFGFFSMTAPMMIEGKTYIYVPDYTSLNASPSVNRPQYTGEGVWPGVLNFTTFGQYIYFAR